MASSCRQGTACIHPRGPQTHRRRCSFSARRTAHPRHTPNSSGTRCTRRSRAERTCRTDTARCASGRGSSSRRCTGRIGRCCCTRSRLCRECTWAASRAPQTLWRANRAPFEQTLSRTHTRPPNRPLPLSGSLARTQRIRPTAPSTCPRRTDAGCPNHIRIPLDSSDTGRPRRAGPASTAPCTRPSHPQKDTRIRPRLSPRPVSSFDFRRTRRTFRWTNTSPARTRAWHSPGNRIRSGIWRTPGPTSRRCTALRASTQGRTPRCTACTLSFRPQTIPRRFDTFACCRSHTRTRPHRASTRRGWSRCTPAECTRREGMRCRAAGGQERRSRSTSRPTWGLFSYLVRASAGDCGRARQRGDQGVMLAIRTSTSRSRLPIPTPRQAEERRGWRPMARAVSRGMR
jgi:hypothetical protein